MRKVLLVCLDNLGDLIFTSVLAEALRQDPDVELSLWCKDYTARIGHLLPGVQQVFAADPFWDKAPGRKKGSLRIFFRTLRTIRKKQFDLALIPSSCWRTAWFLQMIGIRERIGLSGGKNRVFLSRVLPAPALDEPVVAGLLRAFQPVLPHTVPPVTRLDPKGLPQFQLPSELQKLPYVCLHAFAGRRDRCAPLKVLQGLARRLEVMGFAVLWMGTGQELSELRQNPEASSRALYADRWAPDLLSVAWLISRARFFIGHDSGPLHVAGALGIPVLGFYLPGEPRRTMPQGAGPSVMIVRERAQELDDQAAEDGLNALLEKIQS
ncbi:MAG TPA: glycosyltransferase family 9 protein [Oligoflexus sp.]|uniref:glycosyltransferase family 9 protein n=1 Tax=Oligoflexus sp. TaxID=1971216 RepID=UPI002D80C016|nr:glycosyltransferase family 9 protein [Oligoflexus sp.]HET9238130.1 glycosyltransferase family 9 protein [Oligoflexus sp.]